MSQGDRYHVEMQDLRMSKSGYMYGMPYVQGSRPHATQRYTIQRNTVLRKEALRGRRCAKVLRQMRKTDRTGTDELQALREFGQCGACKSRANPNRANH